MIQGIFLDLDDTLLDFRRTEAEALGAVLAGLGLPHGEELLSRYHDINREQWLLLERGLLTRGELRTRRFDILFAERGLTASSEEVCRRYEEELSRRCILLPGARETLEALFPRWPLYLATNGSSVIQRRRLAAGGLERYFRRVFISEDLGAAKPDPAFFRAALEKLGNPDPGTLLMVGDSLTSDIRGGRDAGLLTCYISAAPPPPGAPAPDFILPQLPALPALLERLRR